MTAVASYTLRICAQLTAGRTRRRRRKKSSSWRALCCASPARSSVTISGRPRSTPTRYVCAGARPSGTSPSAPTHGSGSQAPWRTRYSSRSSRSTPTTADRSATKSHSPGGRSAGSSAARSGAAATASSSPAPCTRFTTPSSAPISKRRTAGTSSTRSTSSPRFSSSAASSPATRSRPAPSRWPSRSSGRLRTIISPVSTSP